MDGRKKSYEFRAMQEAPESQTGTLIVGRVGLARVCMSSAHLERYSNSVVTCGHPAWSLPEEEVYILIP